MTDLSFTENVNFDKLASQESSYSTKIDPENLKRLEEKLPGEMFKRVHRSYLANMTNFDTIERMKMIYGKLAIPISESFKDEILKFIEEHEI